MSRPWRIRVRGRCLHMSDEPCSHCDADKLKPIGMPSIERFESFVPEHIYEPWETPRPVHSREELRQVCAERGEVSHYLENHMTFRSRPDRWF